MRLKLIEADFHPHIKARMVERGIIKEEIEKTLIEGWDAEDIKLGTLGKVFVFAYNRYFNGKFFKEKEVTVYYKYVDNDFILLTTKAKYGEKFLKKVGG